MDRHEDEQISTEELAVLIFLSRSEGACSTDLSEYKRPLTHPLGWKIFCFGAKHCRPTPIRSFICNGLISLGAFLMGWPPRRKCD
jgi:hypothetical protein